MTRREPASYRINLTASNAFKNHLEFLREDTGLEDTGVIRLAVAELAKRRGFAAQPKPAAGKAPKQRL